MDAPTFESDNAVLFPGVNSRTELVILAPVRNGALRRWLEDN